MGTPFTDVYDMAMIVINDYKINNIAQSDLPSYFQYMQGLLVKSVPKFKGCLQSLTYDLASKSFNNTLTSDEVCILADYVALTWFESIINDITQVNLKLQGRDKKTHAEGQNLKEKSEYFDRLREKVRQDIADYQLSNFDKVFTGLNG